MQADRVDLRCGWQGLELKNAFACVFCNRFIVSNQDSRLGTGLVSWDVECIEQLLIHARNMCMIWGKRLSIMTMVWR